MARILSIEASTSICSVALHERGALVALAEIKEPGAHAEKLLLLVDEVFEKAGLILGIWMQWPFLRDQDLTQD